MTIDESAPQATSSLVHSDLFKFYNARVPLKHVQLRSLLCSPSRGILYYLRDSNLFSFDTINKRRSLVATLPFEPRCIGVKNGWICCGSAEKGQVAALRIGSDCKDGQSSQTASSDYDMRPASAGSTESLEERPRQFPGRLEEFGGTIVNSVTLHEPKSSDDGDMLAILTNNDHTVRIFSLLQGRLVDTLKLPMPTNHASISPDERYIVVVGDSPNVYFYHQSPKPRNGYGSTSGNWVPVCEEPPAAAKTAGLISTSFSPSSLLCAVASEDGTVTLFNTRYLRHPNSGIIKILPQARSPPAGAIRSVHFSPGPWDLLVCAEQAGQVWIVDLRDDAWQRQIVKVTPRKDSAAGERLETGLAEDDVSDMMLRPPPFNRENEAAEEDASMANADLSTYHNTQHILESLRNGFSHGLPGDSPPQLQHDLPPGMWTTPTLTATPLVYTPATHHTPTYMQPFVDPSRIHNHPPVSSLSSSGVLQPPTSLSTTGAHTSTSSPYTSPLYSSDSFLRETRERQVERERARARNSDVAANRRSNSSLNVSILPPPPPLPPPPHLPAPSHSYYFGSTSHPPLPMHSLYGSGSPQWQIVPSSSSSSRGSTATSRRPTSESPERLARRREHLTAQEERRREYIRRGHHSGVSLSEGYGYARSSLRRSSYSHRLGDMGLGTVAVSGHSGESEITGCSISPEGDKLYVATEDGIMEYPMNLAGRRVFPKLLPR